MPAQQIDQGTFEDLARELGAGKAAFIYLDLGNAGGGYFARATGVLRSTDGRITDVLLVDPGMRYGGRMPATGPRLRGSALVTLNPVKG